MFRQHFRRDLRLGRFIMEFALSAPAALDRVKVIADASLILILSDINMPGMSGLEMPAEDAGRRGNKEARNRAGSHWAADQAHRLHLLREEIDTRLGPAN
jgi:DNA-binding LytR/AlgR family response regulator